MLLGGQTHPKWHVPQSRYNLFPTQILPEKSRQNGTTSGEKKARTQGQPWEGRQSLLHLSTNLSLGASNSITPHPQPIRSLRGKVPEPRGPRLYKTMGDTQKMNHVLILN